MRLKTGMTSNMIKREGRKMTWIKLYADLLDNQEFMSLDNDAQLVTY